jgi:hypothetical protein
MSCPICFDEMDMVEFKDQRAGTETCFKLECGHAFHTKCIIQVLSRTEHKCPSCNQHKTPEEKLELEGVLRKLLREVKNDDRVRIAKHEHLEATKEYKAAMSQLKKESTEWIKKRAAELKILEHKGYYLRSTAAVMNTALEVAQDKGPKFIAAVKSVNTTERNGRYAINIVKSVLFGAHYATHYDWKLRHPRIWCKI